MLREMPMRTYTAVIEKCPDTGLYVGYVPGFPGAHTQAESLDELNANLREVIGMLAQDITGNEGHVPSVLNMRAGEG
jgi:predicted RNase H-like HicB family nuclease